MSEKLTNFACYQHSVDNYNNRLKTNNEAVDNMLTAVDTVLITHKCKF